MKGGFFSKSQSRSNKDNTRKKNKKPKKRNTYRK